MSFGDTFHALNTNTQEMSLMNNVKQRSYADMARGCSDTKDCAIFADRIGYRQLYTLTTNITRGCTKSVGVDYHSENAYCE